MLALLSAMGGPPHRVCQPGVPKRVRGCTHRLPRAECVSLCVAVPKPYLGESPSELAPLAVVFVS